MISITTTGDFKKTESFLSKITKNNMASMLDRYGREGVAALSAATPVESGLTARSWSYEITSSRSLVKITWLNANVVSGVPIAIVLQYGHGTGTGGYVAGRDYINPVIRPLFDRIAEDVWKEVTSA